MLMQIQLEEQDVFVINRQGIRNPRQAIQLLYANALKRLITLLERHLDKVKDATVTCIELNIHKQEGHDKSHIMITPESVQSAQSIEELLSLMSTRSAWDNTCILQQAVDAIPALAIEREVAEAILVHYNYHLDIYERATLLKNELDKKETRSKNEGLDIVAPRKLISLELTSSESLAKFTCKDCHRLQVRVLSQVYGIPEEDISCHNAVSRQSTTVIFLIPNGFTSIVMQRTTHLETVWILLELKVIEVAISGFTFKPSFGSFLTLLRERKSFTADFLGVTEVRL